MDSLRELEQEFREKADFIRANLENSHLPQEAQEELKHISDLAMQVANDIERIANNG